MTGGGRTGWDHGLTVVAESLAEALAQAVDWAREGDWDPATVEVSVTRLLPFGQRETASRKVHVGM